MKIRIVIGLFQFIVLAAVAQLTGPTLIDAGSTQVYTWNGAALSSPSWQVSNGTKISQTSNTATITWNSAATSGGLVLFDGVVWKGSLTVNLKPAAPVASAATSITSGSLVANWGSVSTATSYQLDVSTASNFSSFVSGYNNLTVSGTTQTVDRKSVV